MFHFLAVTRHETEYTLTYPTSHTTGIDQYRNDGRSWKGVPAFLKFEPVSTYCSQVGARPFVLSS